MPKGRKTDDKKDCNIRVRVNEDTRNAIERVAGKRNLSEYLRECVICRLSGVEPEVSKSAEIKSLSVLTEMVNISGGDIETFLNELTAKIENGDILLENGHISKDYEGLDANGFLNACSEAGKDPQSVLDYISMNIWRL